MSRRPAARVVVVLAVALAVLGLVVPGAGARAPDDARADRVLVVGVPGLTWSDVDPDGTPQLWDLAAGSSIGALSVRGARPTTCVLDGWATLGAGNRAGYPVPENAVPAEGTDVDAQAATSRCRPQGDLAAAGLPDLIAVAAQVAADPATARFGAQPGALGRAVGCAAVAGGGASLGAAAPGVALTQVRTLPTDRSGLGRLLSACPLTLVSVAAPSLREVDDAVGRVRAAAAALPGRTLLVVAGVSEADVGQATLHVAIVSGPGFDAGSWLTSPSTGRPPFVQLIDLAPTALRALGIEAPASMNGRPVRPGGDRPALAAAVSRLQRVNVSATVHYRSTGVFFWLIVGLDAALVAAGLLLLGRRRPAGRRVLRVAALALAALPVATFLAGLVPWERPAHPAAVLAAAVALADLAVLGLALAGPWRRHPLGPALVVVLATLATLIADVVTGSHLELDGLLGYDAIVAGRFTGLGNLGSALLSVTALLATTALAVGAARRGRHPRAVAAAVVVAAGLLAVAVIGLPGLGRDFGGVLATLPGFLLLAMLLTGTRVTLPRLAAVLGAGVVAVGTLAYLDWLRPADERSHLGRFVEQLHTGEAWTVISRKADANLAVLLHSPLAWLVPVAVLASVWLVRPGGLLRGGRGGGGLAAAEDRAVLRAGLLACGLTLAVGAAVNDSGVAVPAAAATLLLPLLVWLAAAPGGGVTTEGAGAPVSRRAGETGRVTVGSRGSTDWNA